MNALLQHSDAALEAIGLGHVIERPSGDLQVMDAKGKLYLFTLQGKQLGSINYNVRALLGENLASRTLFTGTFEGCMDFISSGRPGMAKYSFVVTPNDEDPEIGGFFAYIAGQELMGWQANRGAGDTPREAIACLCAVLDEQNEMKWGTTAAWKGFLGG